jgi:hypothetical protein
MFTYKGQKYAAYPMAVKLRNVDTAKAILERIKEIVDTQSVGLQLSAWHNVLQKFPELSMYVGTNGNTNPVTVLARVEQEEKAYKEAVKENPEAEPFDRNAAIERAKQWCTERMQSVILSTPELAKILTFTTGAYPTTIEALTSGIDIVKQIVDRDKTPAETLALIDTGIDSDFWQDADAGEVAAFIDSFRSTYKQ